MVFLIKTPRREQGFKNPELRGKKKKDEILQDWYIKDGKLCQEVSGVTEPNQYWIQSEKIYEKNGCQMIIRDYSFAK